MRVASTSMKLHVRRLRAAAEDERRARELAAAPRARARAWSWKLPERVELGTFSKAAGPWQVDWERAHADARATLDAIDFSRRDIVLWVPGTDNAGVHVDFARGVQLAWRGADEAPSVGALRYEASWHMRRSLPTGLATMKLVLEGIRQRIAADGHASRHRILLAGESQGAWIIGEAAADARLGGLVTRAVTVGHPWLAKTQYVDGRDPRVRTHNHEGDQVAMPVGGDVGVGMDAMTAVRTGQLLPNLGTVVRAILANPIHGVLLLHNELRKTPIRPLLSDPHRYSHEFANLAEFLRSGEFRPAD